MGKAARLNRTKREAEQATGAVATMAQPVPLPPRPAIAPWRIDKALRVTSVRTAMFAHPLPRKRVGCDLCYKQCEIRPGESGWCDYRRNDNGQMVIPEHGLLARSQRLILGYMGTPRHIIGDAGVYLRWRHNWQVRAAGWAPESRFALVCGVIFLPR